MQSTEPTAIPFVYLHNDQFIVSEQAKHFLSQITSPISVLTIVGKYRTGKSLFLNRIMLGKSKAFKVSPTINSCTRGLWLWKDTLKFKHEEHQKEVLIIDTEGFGATEQSDAYNNKILLFALLLSSYFVYNSVGSIDQNSLNNISVLANLANDIQSKNSKDQNIEQNFPSFLWLVRDFTLNLVDKNDIPIQAKEYLEQALEIQKGTSNLIEGKNRIRRMMKHFFRDRDCFTLVRPVETEDKLQQLDTLQEQDFRPTFLDQSKALRQKILQRIKPKKLKNTSLTGETFFELAKNYVDVVNSNSLPNFQNSYKHLLKLQMCNLKRTVCHQHEDKIKTLVKQSMKSLKSAQDFQNMKQSYIQQIESAVKQRIKSHHSLSVFINSEDISSLINDIKSTTVQVFDKTIHTIKQQMKFRYISAINRIKQDNLMSQPLGQIYTDKEFKEFVQRLLSTLNQSLKKYQIPEFLISEFHNQLFVPFKQELMDQFNELNSRRLHESNHEMKIKLEMKEETLKSREVYCQKLQNDIKECRKANSDLELKIVLLEKQLSSTRDESSKTISKMQSTLRNLQQQNCTLTNESLKLQKQLEIRNKQILSLKKALEQKGSEHNLTDRELTIQKERLEAKVQELQQKRLLIIRQSEQLEQMTSNVNLLNTKIQQLRQSKQQLYKNYLSSLQQSSQKIIHFQSIISKQTTELKELKKTLQTSQTHHQQQATYLKQLLSKQYLHNQQLTQTNTHLTQTITNLEQSVAYFYEKQQSYKQFKKCMKNSSSIQCQHCERFFMSSIFFTHLGVCTVFKEKEGISGNASRLTLKEEEIIQFRVINVAVHQNSGKPYTIYQLECQKGTKKWTIEKKFTQFCQFNQNLQNSLPGVEFSTAKTIFNPKYLSQKSLSVEEKQHLIEKYFNDLSQNPVIQLNKYWLEFISSKNPQEPTDSMNNTKRTVMKEINSSNNTLNYQMKKSQIKDENTKPAANHHSSRRQSMHTPEEFFKIWEQKQLRTKASSVCLKKNQHQ